MEKSAQAIVWTAWAVPTALLSVLKKSRENPYIQTVQNPIDKAYNYSDLTMLLKNMSSVHTIFRIANAVESSFV